MFVIIADNEISNINFYFIFLLKNKNKTKSKYSFIIYANIKFIKLFLLYFIF